MGSKWSITIGVRLPGLVLGGLVILASAVSFAAPDLRLATRPFVDAAMN